jgi:uncharacterized membrane protein
LTVWKFDSPDGAEKALELLQRLQKVSLIAVNDAAYVYWPVERKKPKTEQLHSLAGAGALGGSCWGLLFGLIFFVPLLGSRWGPPWGPCPARWPTWASTTTSSAGCARTPRPGRRRCS